MANGAGMLVHAPSTPHSHLEPPAFPHTPCAPATQHRGKIGLRVPDASGDWFQGALVTMIGLATDAALPLNHTWEWVLEKPPALTHVDLYTAMKATRASRLNKPCAGPAPEGCESAPAKEWQVRSASTASSATSVSAGDSSDSASNISQQV